MKKSKLVFAALVSVLPGNGLRTFAYRSLFGYKIEKSRIGFGTIIAVESAKLTESRIGRFNIFIGPMSLVISANASIGSFNNFRCGFWTTEEQYRSANYERSLTIGDNTLITDNHFFDVAGSFVLGKGSWIAGYHSQFWTHGAGVADRNIEIGENCYIGSAARFAPRASIGNNVLVGMGSVITKRIKGDYVMVAGVPAEVVKKNYDWKRMNDIGEKR